MLSRIFEAEFPLDTDPASAVLWCCGVVVLWNTKSIRDSIRAGLVPTGRCDVMMEVKRTQNSALRQPGRIGYLQQAGDNSGLGGAHVSHLEFRGPQSFTGFEVSFAIQLPRGIQQLQSWFCSPFSLFPFSDQPIPVWRISDAPTQNPVRKHRDQNEHGPGDGDAKTLRP
jgi:hypothetical protein